jgi:hypothetical protein
MFKIYLSNRSLNPATSHYILLIEKAILSIGQRSERTFKLRNLLDTDIIVTVEAKDLFKAQLRYPGNKKINWYQGITPEEAMMVYNNPLRKLLWRIFERVALSKSSLNIFVSESMRNHYGSIYHFQGQNYFIMPCYNQQITADSFETRHKYDHPTFVYSGNLSAWQCIDQVLAIFRDLEQSLPGARLLILTAEKNQAMEKTRAFKLNNIKIEYIAPEQLGDYLKHYKYGFLLRQDHIVNRVATPTKMNTYLAHGVIPIYSNVIASFQEHMELGGYGIPLASSLPRAQVIKAILEFERRDILPKEILASYRELFASYYNDAYYIEKLGRSLIEHINSQHQ